MATIPEVVLRKLKRDYPEPFIGRIELHYGPGRGLTHVTIVQSFQANESVDGARVKTIAIGGR